MLYWTTKPQQVFFFFQYISYVQRIGKNGRWHYLLFILFLFIYFFFFFAVHACSRLGNSNFFGTFISMVYVGV